MADVFLSYAHTDAEAMQRLRDDLRAAGLSVWTDEKLEPGEISWQAAVQDAIEAAGCLVVILSPAAKESEWVVRELGYAETMERRVFPVLASGDASVSIPIAIISAQYVDLQSDYARGVERLAAAIRAHLDRAPLADVDSAAAREDSGRSADAPGPTPMMDRVSFRRFLLEQFNSSELGELTYAFELDYNDDLPGQDKATKIVSLITYFERRGRYEELVALALSKRPQPKE